VSESDSVVWLDAVTKRYGGRAATTTALDAITLGFDRGSFTAVMGPRGPASPRCCTARRAWTGRPRARSCWTGWT
jgi:hypothetical protein